MYRNEVESKNGSQFVPSSFAASYFCYRNIELNYEVESKSEWKKYTKFSFLSASSLSIEKINNDNNRRPSFFFYDSAFSAFLLSGKSLFCYFLRKISLPPRNKEEQRTFPNYKMVSISFCMKRKNLQEKKSLVSKQITQWTKIKQDK